MLIYLIDSSLFTLPYDRSLLDGMATSECQVKFFGRPLRKGEELVLLNGEFFPIFYNFSEKIKPGAVRNSIKAVEHFFNNFVLLCKFLKDRPQVVHYQWLALPIFDYFFLILLKLTGVKLFFTVHDTKAFNGSPTSPWQKILWRQSLSLFDGLIVHTKYSFKTLIDIGIPAWKIKIIPHGLLSSEKLTEKPDSSKCPTVLIWGAMKEYKGLDIAIRALALLPVNTCRLKVVGKDCGVATQSRSLAKELGVTDSIDFDFRFVPEREIPNLLHEATIIIFPYRWIDSSGALFFSLNFSCPIIASDLGVFHELFQGDAKKLLFPAGDHVELAKSITWLLSENKNLELATELMEKLRDEVPSWKEIGRETKKFYQSFDKTVFIESDFNLELPGALVIKSPFLSHNKFKRLVANNYYLFRLCFLARKSSVVAPWGLFWIPAILNFAGFKKFKIISLSCDTFLSEKTKNNRHKNFLSLIKYQLALKCSRSVDEFFYCSEVVKNQIINFGVPREKCVFQYREWIRDQKRYHDFARLLPKVASNQFLFIGHCYSVMQKRVDFLVEAFLLIRADFPDAKLIIIGRGWDGFFGSDDIKKFSSQGISFLGETYKLEKYLESSSFYIHPGDLEGFGLAVIEGMLAGLIPLVSEKTGANQAVMELDERLIFSLDISDMVKKMSFALSFDLRQREFLSKRAREIGETYSLANSVPNLKKEIIKYL